jgi:hypothetical protein
MPVKRLVCLASSRKLNGRCVAGIEGFQGRRVGWIRPVSAREHEEVSEYERQYEDGSDPRPLDVMDVPLIEPRPEDYQQENWLLDPDSYWRRIEPLRWDHLHTLADPPAPLWVDGNSTYNGMNDRIPLTQAGEVRTSLRLLRVDRLMLPVFKPGEAFGNLKRRVQGRFSHAGTAYRLWVTDPIYERAYLAKADGDYQISESFITVSLGEPHQGACYKLIAAIMERLLCSEDKPHHCHRRLVAEYLPIQRRLADQPWSMVLGDLPQHPTIAIGEVQLAAGGVAESEAGDVADAPPHLRVRRPALTRAPRPPADIADWLRPGWDDPNGRLECCASAMSSSAAGRRRPSRSTACQAGLPRWSRTGPRGRCGPRPRSRRGPPWASSSGSTS